MEVPSGLWRWLVQCGAVASVRAQKNSSSTGMVRVDKQTEAEIASGIVLSKALSAADPRAIKRLDAIQNNPKSPVARLGNWNLLCATIKRMGIVVSPDDKAQVIAGDKGMLVDVYQSVFEKMSGKGAKGGAAKKRGGRNQSERGRDNYTPSGTGFEGIGRGRGKKGGNGKKNDPLSSGDDADILAVRILEMKVSRAQLEEVEETSTRSSAATARPLPFCSAQWCSGYPFALHRCVSYAGRLVDSSFLSAFAVAVSMFFFHRLRVNSLNSPSLPPPSPPVPKCKHLHPSHSICSRPPMQAAALLESNRRYLTHILMHGIKGSYEPILRWISALQKNIDAFGAILCRDVKSAPIDKMRKGASI